ncbi:MAG: toprim domain-containing protein [Sphingobacteriaceae bacterium]|nr:toprim domain-containing protein [Sphingobacteriaceae bacterium]
MAKKSSDLISLMEFYGVEFFGETKKDEHIADCPFCDKEKHLYVNPDKGCYFCQRCSKTGTFKDFLGFLWTHFESQITYENLALVANARKIPIESLKNEKIGYHKGKYIFPVFLNTGEITDLRYYAVGEKMHSSPGIITGIYKGELLFDSKLNSHTVWICEGEFDCIVLNHLFNTLSIQHFAISLPGANNFKANWAPFFIDRRVICALDNDSAGKQGTDKITNLIGAVTKSFEIINWPDDFPSGYDISDFLVATAFKDEQYAEAFLNLKKLLSPPSNKNKTSKIKYDITGRVTFPDLIKNFKKFLDVNEDFETMIKICLGTVLSGKILGNDPVWMFIVGPPGYGKTAVLSAFKQADDCYFQSTISRHNLVSGFKTPDGSDPSILGLIGHRCLILKDYTEILVKSKPDREEISGILRGAFDGFVERDFGNGVKRRYETNFPMLAGVTDLIKHHSDAELGERMIRFNLNVDEVDFMQQGEKALVSAITGDEDKNELQQYVAYYLNQEWPITKEALLERSTPEFRRRVLPLAKITAILRTKVTRHEKGIHREAVSYRPKPESVNRLAIQFQRLALALSFVEETPFITSKVYNLIKRIAFDTVDGFSTEICQFLSKMTQPVTRDVIADTVKVPKASIHFYLEDLELVGALQKSYSTAGIKKVVKYSLSPVLKELWSLI